ncbi:hypothetical protein DYI37_06610 [Fulvimarina endophytica]|uniref:Poly A polymerase head domain-containing protein n=1 Tax=Fulvimarina endophytica TaxID=2293836 RepID=A0A371X491_9HYPH|nr:hypothetical protein [Fulvimarina endophytica]RFC64033.1 hypothetical protein DYI37_06610 [Fulvimarina endophytica]
MHVDTPHHAWKPKIDCIEARSVPGSHLPLIRLEGTAEVGCADADFAAVLAASRRLTDLLANLEAAGKRYCIFGGWLRDTLAARICGTPAPRDVDLVVAGIEVEALIAVLPADVRPTMFGGVQSPADPVPFDIWPLHETFLIRRLSMPVSFESLLRTADFNINTALYFPAQAGSAPAILDGGMLGGIQGRRLSFNAGQIPFPVMQCARVLAYGAKLDLSYDAPVLGFLREILDSPASRTEIIEGLRRFQPRSVAEKAIAAIRPIMDIGI